MEINIKEQEDGVCEKREKESEIKQDAAVGTRKITSAPRSERHSAS